LGNSYFDIIQGTLDRFFDTRFTRFVNAVDKIGSDGDEVGVESGIVCAPSIPVFDCVVLGWCVSIVLVIVICRHTFCCAYSSSASASRTSSNVLNWFLYKMSSLSSHKVGGARTMQCLTTESSPIGSF
jgi:hypothetical protein